jgi:hypothetical protein
MCKHSTVLLLGLNLLVVKGWLLSKCGELVEVVVEVQAQLLLAEVVVELITKLQSL